VLAAGGAAIAEDSLDPAQVVQRDVKRLIDALYAGDVDTVIGFTHPTIVRMMGGAQPARAATQQALQQVSNLGMKVEELSFPKPPQFLEGGGRKFAIVPTLMIISANGQRIESLNFQLGVLDSPSTSWKYVEGSRVNKQNVQTLFPGFPADYDFPEFYRKKL
jgi:hypothetical protein